MKLWSFVAFMGLFAGAALAQPKVSSFSIGLYEKEERAQLEPAFINAVNAYLHRYGPSLVSKEEDHVKMRVEYDFVYSIELKINADNYEVSATLAQKTSSLNKARKQVAHLSSGVFRTMEKSLMRSLRLRDR